MENLLAGLVAGAASTAALQPIDVVKVRYQVFAGTAQRYGGMWDAVQTIVGKEGLSALYKGLAPAMIGSAVSWGLYMHFYEAAKAALLARHEGETRLSSWEHMGAAMGAGSTVAFLTTPIWMIKTRLQLQVEGVEVGAGKRQYTGLLGEPVSPAFRTAHVTGAPNPQMLLGALCGKKAHEHYIGGLCQPCC